MYNAICNGVFGIRISDNRNVKHQHSYVHKFRSNVLDVRNTSDTCIILLWNVQYPSVVQETIERRTQWK